MITVLMAVYNGEKYLKEQLDSILGQSCHDLRVIVSDDGSSDKSREIIKKYEEREPERIAAVFRDRPSGSAENHFFSLLSQADDDYIMLSDQDDVWLPEKAECLLEKMRKMEEEYGKETPILVHSDMAVTDEKLQVISDSYFQYQHISPERNKLPQLLVQNNVTGGAVMINRAMLPYFREKPEICLMHDSWMALVASCFGKTGWVDKPLYFYRQHGSNSLGAREADTVREAAERLKDGRRAMENYRRMFGQADCLLHMYQDILDENQKEILKAFISLPDQGRIRKICTMLRYGFTKNSVKRTVGQMLFMPQEKRMDGKIVCSEEKNRPAVSICCLAYNHEKYIKDALDSFLMQKTSFPIEVLIHDDASTDGTARIIREYEEKYPDIIKPVYQTENQYSKGIKNISGIFNFPRAQGRYIAMCEGDDYWTDPNKLEKQVAYLDSHPGCSLCFHSGRQIAVDGSVTDAYMRPYKGNRKVSPEEIIDKTSGYAMNSMVFPTEAVKDIPDYYWNCPIGDIPMQLMMASRGWAYYMDEPMSVYRVGVAGSWTDMMKSGDYEKKQKEYSRQMNQMYREFDEYTGGKYHRQAVNAAERIEFLTKVNTKHYDEVFAPENRRFYRELNFRTRFFIRLEVSCPGFYRWLRKKASGGRR